MRWFGTSGRGRVRQLAAEAQTLDLHYHERLPENIRLPRLSASGRPVRATDVLMGERRGRSVMLFDANLGLAVSPVFASCAISPVPIEGPELSLIPNPEHHNLKVRFESEAFNRRWWVRCRDTAFAHDVIDARMMAWLLRTDWPGFFALKDGFAVCYRPRSHGPAAFFDRGLPPEDVLPLLSAVIGFVENLPPVAASLHPLGHERSTE